MIMPIRTDWTLDETVKPEDMNDIGKELNRLKEEDKKLDNKKFDKTGGTVNGPVNATNLQVGGNNVYHTGRKPTSSDVGASPVGHSHDDRYFTEAEMNEKLKTKVSVESGKGLSTNDYTTAEKNKLAGIAAGANAYKHPSTHPATMITEDATHRFVTDTEKNNWNGKAEKTHNHDASYLKLTGGAVTGPIIKNGTGAGFILKNANSRTMMYSSSVAGEHIFGGNNNDTNEPTCYVRVAPNKLEYQTNNSTYKIYHAGSKPTPADIGALGATAKAVSAKTADAVAWANVTGKPSTFAPSSHTHTKSQITDMPTALKNPTAVKVQLNGGTTEGTNQFTYDGSAAKTINVTPANIGALASGGTAVNASKLTGLSPAEMATASTIAKRDSSGDLRCRLLRSEYANQSSISGALAFRTNNSSDNYVRFCSDTKAIRNWLGVAPEYKELKFFGNVKQGVITIDKTKITNGVKVSFMTSNKMGDDNWKYAFNDKYIGEWNISQEAKYAFDFTKIKPDGSVWFYEVQVVNGFRETKGSRRYDGSSGLHIGELNSIKVYIEHQTNVCDNLTALVEYY